MRRSTVEIIAVHVHDVHDEKKIFRYYPHGLVDIVFSTKSPRKRAPFFVWNILVSGFNDPFRGGGHMFFGAMYGVFFDYPVIVTCAVPDRRVRVFEKRNRNTFYLPDRRRPQGWVVVNRRPGVIWFTGGKKRIA